MPRERLTSTTRAVLICVLFLLGAAACTSGNPCSEFKDTGVPPPNLSYGFVDSRAQEADGRPTILLIGDSFVYGAGVSKNETLVAYLQELLDEQGHNYQVINLGIKGYNLPLAFERLQAMLQHYPDTKLVLFEYFTNDYYPASSAVNDPNYASFTKSMYVLFFSHFHPEPDWIYRFRAKFVEPGYVHWLGGERLQLLECNVRGPLNKIMPWLEQEGLTLAVFHTPYHRDPEAETILKGFEEDTSRITYIAVGESIASLITEEYHFSEERLPDKHLNPAGNERVGKELLRQLVDAGLLKSGVPT